MVRTAPEVGPTSNRSVGFSREKRRFSSSAAPSTASTATVSVLVVFSRTEAGYRSRAKARPELSALST